MSVLGNQVLIWSGGLFNRTFITDLSWQSASCKGPYSLLYLPTKDAGSWSPSQTSPRNFRTPPNLCKFQAALCYEARESQNSSAVREGGRRERKGRGVGAGAKTLHICLCKFTYFAKIPWASIPVVQGGKDGQNPPWRPPFLVFSSLWFL